MDMPDTIKGTLFWVMDGAGNDFVVVDLRRRGSIDAEAAKFLGDRSGPFGCDQIITIETGPRMGIWNADGSTAGACGNAARCVASLLMGEDDSQAVSFEGPSGLLSARAMTDGTVEVDMGRPRLGWADIPLSEPVEDTRYLPLPPDLLDRFGLDVPAGASMGNPHATFFHDDAESLPLKAFGPLFERHPLFPDRANISLAEVRRDGIRLRTFERGVGITKACGTAACAALVNAHRLGLTGREADVLADGGRLRIRWDEGEGGSVHMAGPVRLHRQGVFKT